MNEEALAYWQRAQTSLQSAKMLQATDPDGSVSRSYYAAFYAVSALFTLEGATFRKHAGVEAAVHRDLVNKGRWPRDLGAD